jgi:hypothetical protein
MSASKLRYQESHIKCDTCRAQHRHYRCHEHSVSNLGSQRLKHYLESPQIIGYDNP